MKPTISINNTSSVDTVKDRLKAMSPTRACMEMVIVYNQHLYAVLWPVLNPYPDFWWRFRSEHYFLWGSHCGQYAFCSMTHYDITIGNDVARDVHCYIIMSHDVVMCTYHDVTMHTNVTRTPHLLCITTPNCDISVFLVKSLKL